MSLLLPRVLTPCLAALRHPRLTLALAGCATALGLVGAARIHPSASLASIVVEDDPSAAALVRVLDSFSVVDDLMVIASAPPSDSGSIVPLQQTLLEYAHRLDTALRGDREIRDMCTAVTYAAAPEFRAFVERELAPAMLFYLDDAAWVELKLRLSAGGMKSQMERNESLISAPGPAGHALAKTILKDPLRLHELLIASLQHRWAASESTLNDGTFFSKDGAGLLIRVSGARPASDLDFSRAFTRAVRHVADQVNTDKLMIELTGAYAIAAESERSIRGDMIRSILASILLIQLLFLLAYRPGWSFPLALVPVAIGLAVGFGLGSLYTATLTPLVAVIGAMLAGLAIDYAIHFASHYADFRQRGATHFAAGAQTLGQLSAALAAACLTSMVGFLAIGQSGVQALKHFAVFGALALGSALLTVLLVYPALLGATTRNNDGQLHRTWFTTTALRAMELVDARAYQFLFASLVVMLIAIIGLAGGHGLSLESDLTAMHPRPNPPLEAQHALADRFGQSAETFLVDLTAATPQDLLVLAHNAQQLLDSPGIRDQGVAGTLGLASFLPDPRVEALRKSQATQLEPNQILSDFDEAIAQSRFAPTAFADYREFLRRLLSLPAPPSLDTLRKYPDLASMVMPTWHATHQPANNSVMYVFLDHPLTSRTQRAAVIELIRAALAPCPGATLTGMAVLGHDTERWVRHDLTRLPLIAAGVVVFGLLLFYRRVSDALLALLPAAGGIMLLVSAMSVLDVGLNMVNLVGLPLLVGIGVDDGIFLVQVARLNRVRNASRSALAHAFVPAGQAITMTTCTTLFAFASLMFTSTPAIQSLGLVVGLGMAGCYGASIFLLVPLLLIRSARETPQANPFPAR